MADSLTIRQATPDDAEALAALAERSFRDTFAADNAPEDMETYAAEAFAVERVRAETEDARNVTLLAFVPGEAAPVGYARLRTGKEASGVTGEAPIEIERLYADRRVLGRGVGAALMQACLDRAVADGHRTVWLGVWERNARAIAFYERWGFRAVGEQTFRLGDDVQRDLVMARPAEDAG